MATKKRLSEMELKLSQYEKQNKTLSREKEAAIAALSQAQGSQVQKVSQWQETAAIKQREIEELQKKLKASEDKAKALELEKESILNNNATEVANLRSAHSKALETLMGYQEENDVLRSAVMDLSTKNTTAQNSRNNSILPTTTKADDPSSPPPAPPLPSELEGGAMPTGLLAQKRPGQVKSTTNLI